MRLIDPQTGEDKFVDVTYENALQTTPALTRSRPHAYLLPPAYGEVARKLILNGVQVRQLLEPASLDVESYEVVDKNVTLTLLEGHNRVQVRTELVRKPVSFPSGSFMVLMSQPNAELAALALEPESPSSFVSFGLMPVERKGVPGASNTEVPIYRLLLPAPLATSVLDAGAP